MKQVNTILILIMIHLTLL